MTAIGLLLATIVAAPATDSLRTDSEIREVVLRHAAEVRECYETEGLTRNTALSGTVEVELRILPVGRVDSVQVVKSGLKGPGTKEVTECIAAIARNWRFSRGPFSVEAVILPFSLKPLPPGPSSAERRAETAAPPKP